MPPLHIYSGLINQEQAAIFGSERFKVSALSVHFILRHIQWFQDICTNFQEIYFKITVLMLHMFFTYNISVHHLFLRTVQFGSMQKQIELAAESGP
jgi:hypothetical protein